MGALPTATEWDLFLAHAGKDESRALELYRCLGDDRRVFLAAVSVPPGASWGNTIRDALRASHTIVVLLPARQVDSAWYLQDEIASAVQIARADPLRRIIPVLLDDGGDPCREAISLPYGLQHVQPLSVAKAGGMAGIARILLADAPHVAGSAQSRPPPPLPAQPVLFGRDDEIETVTAMIVDRAARQTMIAIDGLGGVGKTALAQHIAARFRTAGTFGRVIWVTAKTAEFDGATTVPRRGPSVSFQHILSVIAAQYGFTRELEAKMALVEKTFLARERLQSDPCLLVVDNLETIHEPSYLLADLQDLLDRSRAVLTSRFSLTDNSAVRSLTLRGLSREASIRFLRHELSARRPQAEVEIDDESLAAIHAATGGLPLAMNLIVGRLLRTASPLHLLLGKLRDVSQEDEGGVYGRLYAFIYADLWTALSEPARLLLVKMWVLPLQGSSVDKIRFVSEQDEGSFFPAMEELIGASLLERASGPAGQLYSLHPMTHHFVGHLRGRPAVR